MSIDTHRAIALRFTTEGWGTRPEWRDVWDEIVADDVIHRFNSAPEPIVGLEANKDFNAGLFEGFPRIERTLGEIVAEGPHVVYRSTLRGSHDGPFLGLPPSGGTVVLDDVTMLRIEDGRIVRWWYDCNLLSLVQQLGLVDLGVA